MQNDTKTMKKSKKIQKNALKILGYALMAAIGLASVVFLWWMVTQGFAQGIDLSSYYGRV